MEAWREELYHYAKGSTAKDHKYIRKEGDRYIYEEPKGGTNKPSSKNLLNDVTSSVGNSLQTAINSATNFVQNLVNPASNKPDWEKEYKEAETEFNNKKDSLKKELAEAARVYNIINGTSYSLNIDAVWANMVRELGDNPDLYDIRDFILRYPPIKNRNTVPLVDGFASLYKWKKKMDAVSPLINETKHSDIYSSELYHYAKGSTAKDHKYIRKEGNRYIYAEPSGANKSKSAVGDWINNAANAVGNWVSTAARDVANAIDPKVVAIQTKLDKVKKEYSDFRGETSVNVYWKKREQLYNDSVKAITDLGATDGEARRLVDLAIVNDTNTINKILNNSAWYTKLSLTNKSKIDDILIPVIQMDKMSEWKEKDSAYKEEIKRLEEELESVKHFDTYSQELYHTAIGGTLIITRR